MFCRDPHSTQTLKVFEDGVEWAAKGNFTEQELELAKISVFQAVSQSVSVCRNDRSVETTAKHYFSRSRQDLGQARTSLLASNQSQYVCEHGCLRNVC